MSNAGQSILQGLEEAVALVRGEDVGAVVHRVAVVPKTVDVKQVRETLIGEQIGEGRVDGPVRDVGKLRVAESRIEVALWHRCVTGHDRCFRDH